MKFNTRKLARIIYVGAIVITVASGYIYNGL